MPSVRTTIEDFVSGTLDYGGLQAEFRREARSGIARDNALDDLAVVSGQVKLSPALNQLISRSIEQHFGVSRREGTGTLPDARTESTSPDGTTARGDEYGSAEPVAIEIAEPAREVVAATTTDDPAAGLPPIYASAAGEDASANASEDASEDTPDRPSSPTGARLPEPGAVLANRFVLQSVLGRGGMGVVYRALDRWREEAGCSNPFVALKIMRRELDRGPGGRQRLFREAIHGQSLKHPNIVAIYDFGRDRDLAFVTMELLEGERLRTRIVRDAPNGMPRSEALRALRGIGEAVAYLHDRGYVHRDVTPGNVLITTEGTPKLLDFGLARRPGMDPDPIFDDADSRAHTPAYASPGLLIGAAPDPRDDVYSLGCIAYEMLTGRHPFDKLAADEAARRRKRPAAIKGLEHDRRRTLRSALSFRADRRPTDAREFLQGMRLAGASRRSVRPGAAQGLLLGVAAGIMLTLAVIHPEGLIGHRFEDPQPEPPVGPSAAAAQPLAEGVPAGPAPARDRADIQQADDPAVGTPIVSDDEQGGDDRTTGLVTDPGDEAADVIGEDAGSQPVAVAGGSDESRSPDAPDSRGPARPGELELAAASMTIGEDTAVLIIDVIRKDGADGVVSLRWRTVDGTARSGEDFVGNDWQRLMLADGQAAGRIFIPLVNDGRPEPGESFLVEISRPEGGATLGTIVRTEIRIRDDDPG